MKGGMIKMWELLRLIAGAGAGFVIGMTFGYILGSDNGFVKGCNWAYYNRDKK